MRYEGTELDGKWMKAVPISTGNRIGQFIYELNTDNVDALLDKIDVMNKAMDGLLENVKILRGQNSKLWDVINGKAELPTVGGGPGDDYNHNQKKRGGHGD